jgi:hypothetical protein
MDLPLHRDPRQAGVGERPLLSMETSPCSAIPLPPPGEHVAAVPSWGTTRSTLFLKEQRRAGGFGKFCNDVRGPNCKKLWAR